MLPSVYFPPPEVVSEGDTLSTYGIHYSWYIKFFAANKAGAYALAFQSLEAIRKARNLIPLMDEDGNTIGKGIRLLDPTLRSLDGSPGVAQLSITWESSRPYDTAAARKAAAIHLNMQGKENGL